MRPSGLGRPRSRAGEQEKEQAKKNTGNKLPVAQGKDPPHPNPELLPIVKTKKRLE
jgi:hypothetical protein